MFNNTTTVSASTPAPTPTQPPSSTVDIETILDMCLTWPFVLLGIVGNLLVVAVMIAKKWKTRILTNNDLFLFHLATVDFLYISFDTGKFTYYLPYFSPQRTTLWYCIVFYPLVSIVYTTGVFTVAAMAIYRCWVITNPFKPKPRPKWIYLSILATWMSALSLFMPLSITLTNKDNYCPHDESKIQLEVYLPVITIAQYPVPLLVMILSYLIIGLYLSKTTIIIHGNTTTNHREESLQESIALAKTVGVVVLLFAILMLPLQIGMLAHFLKVNADWPGYLWFYGDRLAMINSALNPYLYTIRTPQYRQFAKSLLQGRRRSGSSSLSCDSRTRAASFTPSCNAEVAMSGNKGDEKDNEIQMRELDVKL